MRLGVLDVGSNTVHLLVVDAHRGAHPDPGRSHKAVLQHAELLQAKPRPKREAVAEARQAAEDEGVEDLVAFATSAVRDATDGAEVLARVQEGSGVQLLVRSEVTLDASLSGLGACDTDAECPDGQTCKPIERFCE